MREESWNQEAERAALGSAILSTHAAEEVFGMVRPSDFFSPVHATIAAHLDRLVHQRVALDVISLRDSLLDANALSSVGGVEYLIECAEYVPSTANATAYARIVRDKAALRRLERFARNSIEMVQSPSLSIDEKLEAIEASLVDVAARLTPDDRKVIDLTEVVKMVDNLICEARDRHVKGETGLRSFPSRFKAIQKIIGGFEPGNVYTIGARSSMGKTSYLLDEAVNLAVLGHPVLFVSREMTPTKLVIRVVAKLAKVPASQAKKGRLTDDEHQRWMYAQDLIYRLPIRFMTHTRATVAEIRREAKIMQREVGKMPIIFDDYIQMALNGAQNMHMAVSQMMTDYKTMAKELDTPVLILSQLSRAAEGRGADSKRPSLADLKESGSIEENSDVVILMYRDDYYRARKEGGRESAESDAEFIVAKNREGGLGTAILRFRPGFTEFLDS